MSSQIDTNYDDEISAFVARMPEYITFKELKQWRTEFLASLDKIVGHERVALLINTNTHQFESITCLKLLRDLLSSEPQVKHCISRVAFVQPRQYREPSIWSSNEGYFSCFKDAYCWLQRFV